MQKDLDLIIIIFCNVDKFLEKSQCIIWQYGNYTAKAVNKTLNGVNTQGENIADNGGTDADDDNDDDSEDDADGERCAGIKEAYRAYSSWVNRHGEEPRLPGLQKYSPHQVLIMFTRAANEPSAKFLRLLVLSN